MRVKHDPRRFDVNKGGVVAARASKVEAIMGV